MLRSEDAPVVLLAALAIDAVFGDPDWLWRRVPHPVVWIGRLVALADAALNRESWSERTRRLAGIGTLTGVLAISVLLAWALERALLALPGGPLLVAVPASTLIAQRSLHAHVARVAGALASADLAEARMAVSAIVGRDPASLDRAGVARAAIESAAENLSDGIVAPAFWFAVLGLPGIVAYKVVNTADSMLGHLSDRHRAFGWAAARLDDVLNLAPARLSAALIALCAPLVRGGIAAAFRIALRDAPLHRSPNAGWPESAVAGALGLSLGGPRLYATGPVHEPMLNPEGRRAANEGDIRRALRVLRAACWLQALGYALLAGLVACL